LMTAFQTNDRLGISPSHGAVKGGLGSAVSRVGRVSGRPWFGSAGLGSAVSRVGFPSRPNSVRRRITGSSPLCSRYGCKTTTCPGLTPRFPLSNDFREGGSMMGRLARDQDRFVYEYPIEDLVPTDHLAQPSVQRRRCVPVNANQLGRGPCRRARDEALNQTIALPRTKPASPRVDPAILDHASRLARTASSKKLLRQTRFAQIARQFGSVRFIFEWQEFQFF
jgi:hypothetical protein